MSSERNTEERELPVPTKATVAVEPKGSGVIPTAANLTSSIIGSGVLSLSNSLGAAGSLFGSILLVLAALLTQFCFYELVITSQRTQRFSYKGCAEILFGNSIAVELLVILSTFGYCAMYIVIAGTLTMQFIGNLTESNPDAVPSWVNSSLLMVLFGIVICAPLSLMRRVSNFAPFSYAALVIIVYTCVLIIYEFASSAAHGQLFSIPLATFNEKTFKSVPVFILAFGAGPSVPSLYSEFRGRESKGMNLACGTAMIFCAVVYLLIGNAGLYRMGPNVQSNLLLDIGNTIPANIALCGFIYVVIESYPVVLYPCRLSVYSMIDLIRKSIRRKKERKTGVNVDDTPTVVNMVDIQPQEEDHTESSTTSQKVEESESSEEFGAAVDLGDADDKANVVVRTQNRVELSPEDQEAAEREGVEKVVDDKQEKEIWYGWGWHILICFVIAIIAIGFGILVPELGTIAGLLGATAGVIMYFFIPTWFYLNARNFPYSVFGWHRRHLFVPGTDTLLPGVAEKLPVIAEQDPRYVPPTKATFFKWVFSRYNIGYILILILSPIIVVVGLYSTISDMVA